MMQTSEVCSVVARALRSRRGAGEGGPIPLRRGHTGEKCTPLSSVSRVCTRCARLVVRCSLLWVVLEIGLTPARSPRSMRPQHDGPGAAWHAHTRDDPAHAARSRQPLTAHLANHGGTRPSSAALYRWRPSLRSLGCTRRCQAVKARTRRRRAVQYVWERDETADSGNWPSLAVLDGGAP